MKRGLTLFVLLVIGLCSLLPAYAQDAPATPEPGTRADNECYSGGTMAGKCDHGFHADGSTTPAEVDWAWRCGWYIARYHDGVIRREDVPSDCDILLPKNTIPMDCVVAFNQIFTECLSGNILSQDRGSDGTFEESWYVITDSISGDGGHCPAGSIYINEVGDYVNEPIFYPFMLSHGFKATDDLCNIL